MCATSSRTPHPARSRPQTIESSRLEARGSSPKTSPYPWGEQLRNAANQCLSSKDSHLNERETDCEKLSTMGRRFRSEVNCRVSGTTQGGDLEPARLQTIYLLHERQREKHLEERSVDNQYQILSLDAVHSVSTLRRRVSTKG